MTPMQMILKHLEDGARTSFVREQSEAYQSLERLWLQSCLYKAALKPDNVEQILNNEYNGDSKD